MKFVFYFFLSLLPISTLAEPSTCTGTTANGSLKNGVQLPASGTNYTGYSDVARLAGRTYVHSEVRDIIVAAYARLEKEEPQKIYKYAETGFREGGPFKPHKTHRNGLSVDFMTPVKNQKGESVHLPTHPLNRFGYDIEFDSQGQYEDLTIDYDALAAHIVALHKEAKAKGRDIWRVIFDPSLQPKLFATRHGPYLQQHVTFLKTQSWVRHDEHYHVDFAIPCR
jgi:penicillin-insensitive murein endopeptidase